MSRWQEVVRRELARYETQTGYDVAELSELYEQSLPTLREEFPDNQHLKAKLRQILQQLRDRDELKFLGSGVYRIEALDMDTETTAEAAEGESTVEYTAETYETTVAARSLPAAFRIGILDRYDHTCPVSGVDHDRLLDVAHVLPWSDFPEYRTEPANVLCLSKTHHAAFDAGLFTLDESCRLRVSPEFETDSDLLRRTLLDRAGERIELPIDSAAMGGRLREHNTRHLDWWER
ncbi:HNH endonuclease [Halococcus sp. AFM35]|uniref:HNH endonuclease n=1 Tax=Halococcus sp. AFM35 TaxID=3421653 RepID=UPI003EB7DA72